MERVAPSLYSYEAGTKIENTTIKDEPTNNIPPTGEKAIIPIIRRYGFITAALIQRLLNREEHKNINALKSLRKLQQQGKVEKYTITFPSDRQNIDVYILSPGARKTFGQKAVFRYDMGDVPYILEHLSVTQWHVSVMEGGYSKEIMLFKQINSHGFIVQLPSLIEIKSKIGKKINLCAIPVPKGTHKQDLGRLFTNVISIDKYLSERRERYRSYVIILLCDSQSQIDEVSRLLLNMAETKEVYILYSIELMSADEDLDPLSIIYDASRNEGELELSVFKLR